MKSNPPKDASTLPTLTARVIRVQTRHRIGQERWLDCVMTDVVGQVVSLFIPQGSPFITVP